MPVDWLATTWSGAARIVASGIAIFLWLLLITRVTGLRTFSKMASVDFAVTIASGAVLATTITSSSTTVAQGAVALAVLFGIQALVAMLRRNQAASKVLENTPRLLMAGGRFLHDGLRRSRVSIDDVKAKLREANVLRYDQVQAVVLETTGDISVLHGAGPVDLDLLSGVEGVDRLRNDRPT